MIPSYFLPLTTKSYLVSLLELTLTSNLCNALGIIHGGAVCTIIDCATTIGLLSNDRETRKSVSLSLTSNFYKPATSGETILILAETDRIGKTAGFSTCKILNQNLELLYKGTHTKAFLKDKWEIQE